MLASMHDLVAQVSHQNADLSKELARSARKCDELRVQSEELKRKLLSMHHEKERQQIQSRPRAQQAVPRREYQHLSRPMPQFLQQASPVVPEIWPTHSLPETKMYTVYNPPLQRMVSKPVPTQRPPPPDHYQQSAPVQRPSFHANIMPRQQHSSHQKQGWQTVPISSVRSAQYRKPPRGLPLNTPVQVYNRFSSLSNSPRCHFCSETGHMKCQCVFKEPIQCFTCFNYGHKSKFCDQLSG